MRYESFDGVSPTSGNRGIQDTRYIYDMNFSLVSTTSQPQDEHKYYKPIVQIQSQITNRVHARHKS